MIRAVDAQRTRAEGEGQAIRTLDPTDPSVTVKRTWPMIPHSQGVLHTLLHNKGETHELRPTFFFLYPILCRTHVNCRIIKQKNKVF